MVNRCFFLVVSQFKKPFLFSPLQLVLAGLLLYYLAMAVGADYACADARLGPARTAFSCQMGDMPVSAKAVILGLIVIASLACGRAVNMVEVDLAKRE